MCVIRVNALKCEKYESFQNDDKLARVVIEENLEINYLVIIMLSSPEPTAKPNGFTVSEFIIRNLEYYFSPPPSTLSVIMYK